MSAVNEIIRQRQLAIRRELDRRQIPLKVIAFDSGIPYPTLLTYFPGGERPAAEMPTSAAFALCGIIPDDLMNLLCPQGYALVPVPVDANYDDVNQHCMEFIAEKAKAHHPESEAGVEIGPNEQAHLACKVIRLRGRVA
jgi:hypothetical protein